MITIEDLQEYRKLKARILALSTYSVGSGIMLSRLNEDDQLQDLHKRLGLMPSYMYLSEHEQELEMTARANLERFPAGTKAQYREVDKAWRRSAREGNDPEETEQLRETRQKIKKVVESRSGERDDIDGVIDRLAELQEKQAKLARIDSILDALEIADPNYARLLRLKYVEGRHVPEIADEMGYTDATIRRWRRKAAEEFEKLAN